MWGIIKAGGPVMWPLLLLSVISLAIIVERLYSLQEKRILLSPHIAWVTEEAEIELREHAAEEVARVLKGEPLQFPLMPQMVPGLDG